MSTARVDVRDPGPVVIPDRFGWRHNRWLRGLAAVLAGAVTGLAWQPYGLWPLLLIAVMFRAIEAFRLFALVYILTSGGPGVSTETLSFHVYKVAFLGFLEAQQSDDATYRDQRLDAHVRHMRKHVDDLAGKKYWNQFEPAPEFVVMFVPAEAFLSAALERAPELLEYAAQRNVIIATPTTMLALLRTVAYAWRQEALAENAQKVLTVGKELYARLIEIAGGSAGLSVAA